jgi:leader peptidase (prepilin peptidase) / N-methyltransferase
VSLELLFGCYATILGLIVGSYLNVVIYRLPLGISTVLPRSRCPACGAAIRAWDNVPVVSFLLLRGRCRACGAPISLRYPLIEVAAGLLFLGSFLRFGITWAAVAGALFSALMVALAMIDLDHMILPDVLTWPGIAAGILLQPLVSWAAPGAGGVGPWRAMAGGVLGAAVGGGILLAVWGGWYLLRHEEGMGFGDVKMLAAIGAFLGWQGVLVSLFFGALSGAIVGLSVMAWRGGGLKSKLPFGTFLALGGLIALFAGERIVAAYVRLL